MIRLRTFLAALGVSLAGTLSAQASEPANKASPPNLLGLSTAQPAPAPVNSNQQLAEEIAARLRQSKALKNFHIDLSVHQGVVEMDGQVASTAQQTEVFNLIAAVPGVEKVVDRLQIAVVPGVTPAQHTLEAPKSLFGDPPVIGPMPKQEGGPGPSGPPEPTPIFQAGPPPMPNAYAQPKMPPYAWPTYAPYNNFSRVAMPTEYPYNAWPFIGPVYPFPKIPPGWRSVHLTWRDGFWWYGRNSSGYDWWTVRYW